MEQTAVVKDLKIEKVKERKIFQILYMVFRCRRGPHLERNTLRIC